MVSLTPDWLLFDEPTHAYTDARTSRALLHVTGVLATSGLQDRSWFTEADRLRGQLVHRAIEQRVKRPELTADYDALVGGAFVRGFDTFLADTALRIDACEEQLADDQLMVAGTLDLRGRFMDAESAGDRIDVIDVKTGSTPPWVGLQLAGYARLLPPTVRTRVRRWCLTLKADGTYRLDPLTKRSDDTVFMAAVAIAQFKQGWI